jgi:hypothetical protein
MRTLVNKRRANVSRLPGISPPTRVVQHFYEFVVDLAEHLPLRWIGPFVAIGPFVHLETLCFFAPKANASDFHDVLAPTTGPFHAFLPPTPVFRGAIPRLPLRLALRFLSHVDLRQPLRAPLQGLLGG